MFPDPSLIITFIVGLVTVSEPDVAVTELSALNAIVGVSSLSRM